MKIKLQAYNENYSEPVWKLFYETVHSIDLAYYTEEQLDTWAPENMDLLLWNQRILSNDHSVVAKTNDTIIGIGSADEIGYFDLLYVHKNYQRMGVATIIADAIETYLRGKGVIRVEVDASINSIPFFKKRGYILIEEQNIELRGQILKNYKMHKNLVLLERK